MSLLQITINAGTPEQFREAISALASGVAATTLAVSVGEMTVEKPARTRRTKAEVEADNAAAAATTEKAAEPEKPAGKPAATEKAALRSRGAIVDEPPADEPEASDAADADEDEDDGLGAKPVDVEALKADLQAIRAHSAPALADLLQKHGGSPKFREVKDTSYAAIQAAASAYIKKHNLTV